MKFKILIASAFFSLLTVTATAQRGIRTLRDEDLKIRHGVKNGSLTRREACQLKRQERKLKMERRRFLANDGRLGPAERLKLRKDEKRLDRNIRRQKHDRQSRF